MATWETRLQTLVSAKLEGSDTGQIIREIIAVMAEMGTPLAGTSRGLPSVQAEIVKIQTELARQDTRIAGTEAAVLANSTAAKQTKGILESKALAGLKVLEQDKVNFKA